MLNRYSFFFDGLLTKGFLVFLKITILVTVSALFGVEGRGVVVSLLTLSGLSITFSNLGLPDAILQRVAARSKSPIGYSRLIYTAIFSSLCISIILFTLLAVTYQKINLPLVYFLIASAMLPSQLAELFGAASLRALEKHSIVNFFSLIGRVLNLIVIVLVYSLFGDNLIMLLIGYTTCSYITSILFLNAFKRFSGKKAYGNKNLLSRFSILLKRGLVLHPMNLILDFENRLDTLLILFFLGVFNVAIYATGVSFVQVAFYSSNVLASIIFTKLSKKTVVGAVELCIKAQKYAIICSFLLGVISLTLGFVIIQLFLDPTFFRSLIIMCILLPGIICDSTTRMISTWAKSRMVSLKFLKGSLISLLLSGVSCVIFIKMFGLYGAAASSSILYIFRAFIFRRGFINITNNNSSVMPTFFDLMVILKASLSYGKFYFSQMSYKK